MFICHGRTGYSSWFLSGDKIENRVTTVLNTDPLNENGDKGDELCSVVHKYFYELENIDDQEYMRAKLGPVGGRYDGTENASWKNATLI